MNQGQITQTVRKRKPNPLVLESTASRRRVSHDRGRTRGVPAGKTADIRVVAIPDRRFVHPGEFERQADCVLDTSFGNYDARSRVPDASGLIKTLNSII